MAAANPNMIGFTILDRSNFFPTTTGYIRASYRRTESVPLPVPQYDGSPDKTFTPLPVLRPSPVVMPKPWDDPLLPPAVDPLPSLPIPYPVLPDMPDNLPWRQRGYTRPGVGTYIRHNIVQHGWQHEIEIPIFLPNRDDHIFDNPSGQPDYTIDPTDWFDLDEETVDQPIPQTGKTHQRTPPGRRTKERKVKTSPQVNRLMFYVSRVWNFSQDYVGIVNAIYKSINPQVRKGIKARTLQDKLSAIYDHVNDIESDLLVKNFAKWYVMNYIGGMHDSARTIVAENLGLSTNNKVTPLTSPSGSVQTYIGNLPNV